MVGPFRSFPFRGLALVALGFVLAGVLAGNGPAAGLGFLVLVPLFLFKMFFVFLLFGTFLRLAGGGWGSGPPWGPGWGRGGPWGHRGRGSSTEDDDHSFDAERQEWEESLRQAREELREYDTPFSRPPRGFEPADDEEKD